MSATLQDGMDTVIQSVYACISSRHMLYIYALLYICYKLEFCLIVQFSYYSKDSHAV